MSQYLNSKGEPVTYLNEDGNPILPGDTFVGPEPPEIPASTKYGPEDDRSMLTKFTDAHPYVKKAIDAITYSPTQITPQMREMMHEFTKEHPVIGPIGEMIAGAATDTSPLSVGLLLAGEAPKGLELAGKLELARKVSTAGRIAGAGFGAKGAVSTYNALADNNPEISSAERAGKVLAGLTETGLGALAATSRVRPEFKLSPEVANQIFERGQFKLTPREVPRTTSVKLELQPPKPGVPEFNTAQFGLKPTGINVKSPEVSFADVETARAGREPFSIPKDDPYFKLVRAFDKLPTADQLKSKVEFLKGDRDINSIPDTDPFWKARREHIDALANGEGEAKLNPPNRLKGASPNATVFNALVPDELKFNEQGAAKLNTVDVQPPKLVPIVPTKQMLEDAVAPFRKASEATIEDKVNKALGRGNLFTNEKGAIGDQSGPKTLKELQEQRNNNQKTKDDYIAIGSAQRGVPENAMLKVQSTAGGGVINPLVEHVGDLTHRMNDPYTWNSAGYEFVKDKVDKALRWLNSGYGFSKEFNENLISNAKYRKIDPEQLKSDVTTALDEYANAHAQLPAYNKAQELARDAAVAIGKQDFDLAKNKLEALQNKLGSKEEWKAFAHEGLPNESGRLNKLITDESGALRFHRLPTSTVNKVKDTILDAVANKKITDDDHLFALVSNSVKRGQFDRILADLKSSYDMRRQFRNAKAVRDSIANDLINSTGRVDLKSLANKYSNQIDPKNFYSTVNHLVDTGDLNKPQLPNIFTGTQDLMQKLLDHIQEHEIARAETDQIRRGEKRGRIETAAAIDDPTFAGTRARLDALSGKYTTKNAPPPSTFSGADIDPIIAKMREIPSSRQFDDFDKINTEVALRKLTGEIDRRGPLQPSEIELLRQVFGADGVADIADTYNSLQRLNGEEGFIKIPKVDWKDLAAKTSGVLKSTTVGGDLGWPLRQAAGYIGKPHWFKGIYESLKAFGTQELAEKGIEKIRQDPFYPYAEKMGVELTDFHGKNIANREETMPTDFWDKVAETGKAGASLAYVFRGSNRAATVGLDTVRLGETKVLYNKYMKQFKELSKDAKPEDYAELQKLNPDNPYMGRKIADMVNTSTARGKTPDWMKKNAKELNILMMSPKMVSSKIRMLNRMFQAGSGIGLITMDSIERRFYLRQLLSIAGAVGATNAIAGHFLGAKTDNNLSSSGFLRSKAGNTTFDASGGNLSYINAIAKELTGFTTSGSGKLNYLDDYGFPGRIGLAAQTLITNRESPLVGLATAIVTGKEFGGKPTNYRTLNPFENTLAKSTIIPIIYKDLYDLAVEDPELFNLSSGKGAANFAGAAAFDFMGGGVNSYNPKESKAPKRPKPVLQKLGPLTVPFNPNTLKSLKDLGSSISSQKQ